MSKITLITYATPGKNRKEKKVTMDTKSKTFSDTFTTPGKRKKVLSGIVVRVRKGGTKTQWKLAPKAKAA